MQIAARMDEDGEGQDDMHNASWAVHHHLVLEGSVVELKEF